MGLDKKHILSLLYFCPVVSSDGVLSAPSLNLEGLRAQGIIHDGLFAAVLDFLPKDSIIRLGKAS